MAPAALGDISRSALEDLGARKTKLQRGLQESCHSLKLPSPPPPPPRSPKSSHCCESALLGRDVQGLDSAEPYLGARGSALGGLSCSELPRLHAVTFRAGARAPLGRRGLFPQLRGSAPAGRSCPLSQLCSSQRIRLQGPALPAASKALGRQLSACPARFPPGGQLALGPGSFLAGLGRCKRSQN